MRFADAATRGARLIAAKLTGSAVPFHVTVYPTMRCNLRCVYCSSPYEEDRELSLDVWRRIFDELRELGTSRICFLGGEPLIRADIGALVSHARAIGLSCSMTTNGTLVPRRAELIKQ